MITLSVVRDSFLETLLWSEMDDNGESLDNNCFLYGDISEDTMLSAQEFCEQFIEMAGPIIDDDSFPMNSEAIGHNIALTCNGHCVGFWDLGLGEAGDRLTEICKSLGCFHLYVGDDDLIYHLN